MILNCGQPRARVHLLLLGILLYRSRLVPRFLGLWLTVGSLGYLAYSVGTLILGTETPKLVFAPAGIAELVLSALLIADRIRVRS